MSYNNSWQSSFSPLKDEGKASSPSLLQSSSVNPTLAANVSGYFRLDSHHDQLVFGTDADLDNNVRFKMLQMRKNKVAEFRNYKMIPITEKEIPRGLLETSMKKLVYSH